MRKSLLLASLVLASTGASAQTIASQSALDSLLGSNEVNISIVTPAGAQGGGAIDISASTVDSTNYLSAPGASFTTSSNTFQIDDTGYYGAPAPELESQPYSSLFLNFASPTQAFGINVRDFDGFSTNATITVFGADDTTVLYTGALTTSGTAQFFGYEALGGIGEVEFSGSEYWSPIVSGLSFGEASQQSSIPEPTALALLGAGLLGLAAARRARA